MKNHQLIPASAFVVMVMGTIASVSPTKHGKPRKANDPPGMPGANFWIGLAISFTAIAVVEEIQSEVASMFALLVMVTSLMVYGEDVMNYTSARTAGKITSKKKPAGDAAPGAIITVNGQRYI